MMGPSLYFKIAAAFILGKLFEKICAIEGGSNFFFFFNDFFFIICKASPDLAIRAKKLKNVDFI